MRRMEAQGVAGRASQPGRTRESSTALAKTGEPRRGRGAEPATCAGLRDCRSGGGFPSCSTAAGATARAGAARRPVGEKGAPDGRDGRARARGRFSPHGQRKGPRRGLLRLVNLFPLPFNPPPGRLSFQDVRGCKPFEVHQHGEVLLYFRSPRFIPGRGSGQPGRLLRSLGLPRRTRGHSDTRLRGEGGREPGLTGRERSPRTFRRPLHPAPPPLPR